MQKAGITVATSRFSVGVAATAEHRFTFDWLDEILDGSMHMASSHSGDAQRRAPACSQAIPGVRSMSAHRNLHGPHQLLPIHRLRR